MILFHFNFSAWISQKLYIKINKLNFCTRKLWWKILKKNMSWPWNVSVDIREVTIVINKRPRPKRLVLEHRTNVNLATRTWNDIWWLQQELHKLKTIEHLKEVKPRRMCMAAVAGSDTPCTDCTIWFMRPETSETFDLWRHYLLSVWNALKGAPVGIIPILGWSLRGVRCGVISVPLSRCCLFSRWLMTRCTVPSPPTHTILQRNTSSGTTSFYLQTGSYDIRTPLTYHNRPFQDGRLPV